MENLDSSHTDLTTFKYGIYYWLQAIDSEASVIHPVLVVNFGLEALADTMQHERHLLGDLTYVPNVSALTSLCCIHQLAITLKPQNRSDPPRHHKTSEGVIRYLAPRCKQP